MTVADAGNEPNSSDGQTAVSLADVTKTYHLGEPVYALSTISLDIEHGSYTAVMGPSGSGKSTLMNLVGCLDTPTEGRVSVGGEYISELTDDEKARLRGETVGFVFQTFNLMPRLTAGENVSLPMVFRGRPRDERDERARKLLSQVGLGNRVTHQPNELSGGQRQRVAIARALANDPSLILADEPTGNLDTETGAGILDVFGTLHNRGNTILLVTHERPVAEYADRIVHLHDGKIEDIEHVSNPRRNDSSMGYGTTGAESNGEGTNDEGANAEGHR